MKYFFTALVVIHLPINVVGQDITPSLVNISGFDFEDASIILSSSIGESAITTIQNGDGLITQGFLQPESLSGFCEDINLVYYPNPIEDIVTIQDITCGSVITRIEIYDTFGKLILNTPLSFGSVDLTLIGLGIFIVRAYGIEDRYLDSFKLMKVTNN